MRRGTARGGGSYLARPRRRCPSANRGGFNCLRSPPEPSRETFLHRQFPAEQDAAGCLLQGRGSPEELHIGGVRPAAPTPAERWQPGCSGAGWRRLSRQHPCVDTSPQYRPPQYRRQEDAERGSDTIRLNLQRLSLAGKDREQEILGIFRQLGEQKSCTVHDLAHKLKTPKKEVNRVLYQLLREGKLQKGGETPPLWRIASPSASRERSPAGRSAARSGAAPESRVGERSAAGSGDADPTMAETKDKICNYLFSVAESTALNLAKNIGFSRAKDVNAFLSALEKLGDVHKQNTSPPRWSLTGRKRERMQMRLKASAVTQTADPTPELGFPLPCVPPCPQEVTAASPAVTTTEEESLENGQQPLGQTEQSDASDTEAALPEDAKPKFSSISNYDNSENDKWATDDIPDNLNTIGQQPEEPESVLNPQPPPSCAAQFEAALPCTPMEKLMACQEKNPVSGLTEYSQYTYQHCEFAMLEQSGPSHEPR